MCRSKGNMAGRSIDNYNTNVRKIRSAAPDQRTDVVPRRKSAYATPLMIPCAFSALRDDINWIGIGRVFPAYAVLLGQALPSFNAS